MIEQTKPKRSQANHSVVLVLSTEQWKTLTHWVKLGRETLRDNRTPTSDDTLALIEKLNAIDRRERDSE